MAFSDDVFPPVDRCEICGAGLDDEIVIQEFADGSLARLCAECAAGAALEPDAPRPDASQQTDAKGASPVDLDPMEVSRELLPPVVDLLALQGEMQTALRRLATSLEGFTGGSISNVDDKTAALEDRVRTLEVELEHTRARLQETEFLLQAATEDNVGPEPLGEPKSEEAVAGPAPAEEVARDLEAVAAEAESPFAEVDASAEAESPFAEVDASAEAESPFAELEPPSPEEEAVASFDAQLADSEWTVPTSRPAPVPPPFEPEDADAGAPAPAEAEAGIPAEARVSAEARVPAEAEARAVSSGSAGVPPVAAPGPEPGEGFQLEEVRLAQRYFNESPFTGRVREVRTSLGRPQANLTRAPGPEPRAFVTVAWNIVWYQYLVDLRRDAPGRQRVVLHREGMDLDELPYYFKEKNATVDDHGRLDASELEVRLLSDPSTLITEMTPEEQQRLEDATEEIWDQRLAPEFKWDD